MSGQVMSTAAGAADPIKLERGGGGGGGGP